MSLINLKSAEAPHSIEAERSVLGAILLENRSLYRALELRIQPEDFYLDSHQKIFELMLHLSQQNKPLDLVTLTEELRVRGWFEPIGGTQALTSLFEDAFAVGNVRAYVEIVQKKAMLRRIIQVGSEMVSDAYGAIPDTDDFLDEIESKIFGISDKEDNLGTTSIKNVFLANLQSIEEMALKKTDVTGLRTGFRDLDHLTGGLNPGQLVILAARPSMGKTSLFLNVCQSVVSNDPKAVVAVFSLEMAKEELGIRILSGSAKIPSNRLKTGRLVGPEWGALMSATQALSEAKIEISDSSEQTVLDIRAACRRILARHKRLDFIAVDYLQLMKGTKSSQKGEGTREREVSEISRGLKSLAKELRVPIMALSQLNRSLETRPNKRPLLSDLRESGSIEADADIVLFIYRDEKYNPETEEKGIAELIVAKHRAGPTGTIRLKWDAEHTLFSNLEQPKTINNLVPLTVNTGELRLEGKGKGTL